MSRNDIQAGFVKRFASMEAKPPVVVAAIDLQSVEKELSTVFPRAYFDFLTRYGSVHTPDILRLIGGDSENIPEGFSFDVQKFLEAEKIAEVHRLYTSGGMEDWLIPIASDCMGNLFGFKRNESDVRHDDAPVFLFDHDFCETHQEADSFDAWLESFIRLMN